MLYILVYYRLARGGTEPGLCSIATPNGIVLPAKDAQRRMLIYHVVDDVSHIVDNSNVSIITILSR